MKTLGIDIETFSSEDLAKSGVYRYTESPDFTILLISYQLNGGPVKIVDLASGEPVPYELLIALRDPYTLKTAHNANFERTCLAKYLGFPMPPEQWKCTMAWAAQLGLPLALDTVSKVLGIGEKKADGKALIKYFCVPCKPTKVNGGRTRNLPTHDPEKWQKFKEYCCHDVVLEQTVRAKISWFIVPQMEVEVWNLDQRINDRGVLVDIDFVKKAVAIYSEYYKLLLDKAMAEFNINPKSQPQFKKWLEEETEEELDSVGAKQVEKVLNTTDSERVKKAIYYRQELSKSSVKKFHRILKCVCSDGRVRGLLQYGGAGRTGRWAGRLVQIQNLKRNVLADLDLARELVKEGDGEMLRILFGDVIDTLSQLIRTAFISSEGHSLTPCDESAIEARVLAWLADERWRLEVFQTHGKIYEASASQMFKVPIESIGKGSDLRQKGKVSELALGYQGSVGALIQMGALDMGIAEEDLPELVASWRKANPKIVRYW